MCTKGDQLMSTDRYTDHANKNYQITWNKITIILFSKTLAQVNFLKMNLFLLTVVKSVGESKMGAKTILFWK